MGRLLWQLSGDSFELFCICFFALFFLYVFVLYIWYDRIFFLCDVLSHAFPRERGKFYVDAGLIDGQFFRGHDVEDLQGEGGGGTVPCSLMFFCVLKLKKTLTLQQQQTRRTPSQHGRVLWRLSAGREFCQREGHGRCHVFGFWPMHDDQGTVQGTVPTSQSSYILLYLSPHGFGLLAFNFCA